MARSIDPTKTHFLRAVALDKVGLWCAALDVADGRLFAGGTDNCIHLFNLPDLKPASVPLLRGHTNYVTALVYLPESRQLISGSFDKQLLWWDPSQPAPIRRVKAGGRVNRLAVSPDGRLLAAVTDDRSARLWDVHTGQLRVELKDGHPPTTAIGRANTLYAVAFSPDGKTLATGDRAGTICLWDIDTSQRRRQTAAGVFYSQALFRDKQPSEYEWGGIRCLAFAPDGARLLAGGMGPADQNSAGIDGPMRLEVFDAATGKSQAAFMPGPKGLLLALVFHPTGDWLIAGGGGGQAGNAGIGSLWLWSPRQLDKDKKPVAPVTHKSDTVLREVLLVGNGTTLYAVGMQRDLTAGRVEIWDL